MQAPAITCGDRLRNMTNELGPDVYNVEFLSGLPKN